MRQSAFKACVFFLACTGLVTLAACEGTATIYDSAPDEHDPDATNPTDLGHDFARPDDTGLTPDVQTTDAGPDQTADPCANVSCGANASCAGGTCTCDNGFQGDPTTACTPANPCTGVSCSYGATCNAGQCTCDTGFDANGQGGCTPQSPGDTAARSQIEVCDRWNADRQNRAQTMFQVEPADMCDPGILHPDVITDALRRTTLFRWLVGLPAVTSLPNMLPVTQACATTLAASNRGLSHSLDASYTCFTPEAAQGAGSSNLAFGIGSPADSVDLYVGDNGVRSLGHRRWVLNPGMGATAFGQRGSYSCMYAFDGSSGANPQFVAYPAPGFFPRAALIGYWSFGSNSMGFSDQTTVTIKTAAGVDVPVNDVYVPGGGYGIQVIAWQVPNAQVDVDYDVTIANLSGATPSVTYRTRLVNCN